MKRGGVGIVDQSTILQLTEKLHEMPTSSFTKLAFQLREQVMHAATYNTLLESILLDKYISKKFSTPQVQQL